MLAVIITVAIVGCLSEEKNDSGKSITNQESSVKQDIPEGIKEEVGDGMLNSKEQLGDMSKITLTLESDALNEGVHDVEVVQFDNDETTGNHITYKKESYEVKMK